jgi:hypothetical protein
VSFLDFGCVKRLHRDQVHSLNLVMRECLRGDVGETWRVSVEGGFFSPSDSLTPEEVFEYWWKPIGMYWGEQPFTVTPEYVAALIESRYSPTGPMANAFRQMTSPPAYTTMSRIDIGAMSLISELRGENYWKTIAAEYFENADPVTPMGKLDGAYRAERQEASSHA